MAQPDSDSDKDAEPVEFETSLAELEALVERLEGGDLSLEESLKQFERGIELTRTCQQALKQAEQTVEILLQKDNDTTIQPLDVDDDRANSD